MSNKTQHLARSINLSVNDPGPPLAVLRIHLCDVHGDRPVTTAHVQLYCYSAISELSSQPHQPAALVLFLHCAHCQQAWLPCRKHHLDCLSHINLPHVLTPAFQTSESLPQRLHLLLYTPGKGCSTLLPSSPHSNWQGC